MPSAITNLSGYGPQQVYLYLAYVSYDQGGNYSTWYWEIVYKNNGGAQWISDAVNAWSLGGFAVTGQNYFGIPSSWAGSGDHLLGSGYFTKAHDANGYLIVNDNFYGAISSPHEGIGSGTAAITSGITAPRIPKPPPAPSVADPWGWNQIQANQARFQFSSTGDGGGTIDTWEFQVATNPSFTGATTYSSGGTTIVTGLTPGTTYYARARGHSIQAGWGAWSATDSMTTLPGVYVSDGVNWVASPMAVSDGASWANVVPKISSGSAWQDPVSV